MEYTKEDVQEAIITIAKKFNLKESYSFLINEATLPELIKMIVYKMFVEEFSRTKCSLEESKAYDIILEYARELSRIGFVTFKK